MNHWGLFKYLLKQTGFYYRQFLFFMIIILVGAGIYYFWQAGAGIEADTEIAKTQPNSANQVKMEIVVEENGRVLINNQKTKGAIKFYEQFDELRIMVFNAPGYFIRSFEGIVHLPAEVTSQNIRQIIYSTHGVGSYQHYVIDSRTLAYKARDISPQGVLTIVAELPKGLVKPNLSQKIQLAIQTFPLKSWFYVAIFLPAITIILMIFMIIKRRASQIFSFKILIKEPPTTDPPAIVGVLIDGAVSGREIAATLIDLARRRFIYIINKGGGQFSFGKRRQGDYQTMKELYDFERFLLAKIFSQESYKSTMADVEMRIGRHIFSRKIAQFYLGVYNWATKKNYFVQNPAKVHLSYKYLGIVLFFLSFLGFMVGAFTGADPKFSLIFWLGGMAAAVVMIKLSPYMPARTKVGRKTLENWLSFRKYLSNKKNLVAGDVLLGKFEEYLPYAVALGCEVEWAKSFGDEPFAKPDWYESAERVVTLESFAGQFYPFIGYVAENLAKSHEPTVE